MRNKVRETCRDARSLVVCLRAVLGVSEGEEPALRASSMSRLSWSNLFISWVIDSDQGGRIWGDSCMQTEETYCRTSQTNKHWGENGLDRLITLDSAVQSRVCFLLMYRAKNIQLDVHWFQSGVLFLKAFKFTLNYALHKNTESSLDLTDFSVD